VKAGTRNLPARLGQLGELQVNLPADKIDWDSPDSMPSYNANQVVTQVIGGQLHLNFFELLLPLATDPKVQKSIKRARAKGQCRIVVSPELAMNLLKILSGMAPR
jgi:hypothetical protein